jgi:SAM-dependent methyltransferase
MSDHFSAVAGDYARYRPGYPPELFAWLAGLVPARHTAWDCATGSGQAAIGLAGHFERVVATDLSSSQLAHAAPHPAIDYRVATADASGLPPGSVELVTVAQALHWLDHDRFYAEVRRVTVPGGVLAAWCYNMLEVDPRVNAVVGRYYSRVVGPYWPPERRLLEAGYRTLPFPFEEIEPPQVAMEARWTLARLRGYLATWSAAQRYAAAERADPLEKIATDLADAWGDPDQAKRVRWPLHFRVGRVGRVG